MRRRKTGKAAQTTTSLKTRVPTAIVIAVVNELAKVTTQAAVAIHRTWRRPRNFSRRRFEKHAIIECHATRFHGRAVDAEAAPAILSDFAQDRGVTFGR